MKKRAFWLASLAAVSAAILLHVGALGQAFKGVKVESLIVNANTPENQRPALRMEARQFYKAANTFRFIGVTAAILSFACLFVSYRKDEPAVRSITIVMLAFYLLLQLGAV